MSQKWFESCKSQYQVVTLKFVGVAFETPLAPCGT